MSHYSLAQKPKELLKWAEAIAIDIYIREISYPVLVYRGMSGISAATAISLQLYILGIKHGMVYVRKENEDSHGDEIESEDFDSDNTTFIFVDDFVFCGETKSKCLSKIIGSSWFPEDKTQFDYCAVQEVRGIGSVFKLADHTGVNLCKN